MNKTLLKTLEVVANCPAYYNQNIKRIKEFDDQYCINSGHNINGSFYNCPLWNKKVECWKLIYDKYLFYQDH